MFASLHIAMALRCSSGACAFLFDYLSIFFIWWNPLAKSHTSLKMAKLFLRSNGQYHYFLLWHFKVRMISIFTLYKLIDTILKGGVFVLFKKFAWHKTSFHCTQTMTHKKKKEKLFAWKQNKRDNRMLKSWKKIRFKLQLEAIYNFAKKKCIQQ